MGPWRRLLNRQKRPAFDAVPRDVPREAPVSPSPASGHEPEPEPAMRGVAAAPPAPPAPPACVPMSPMMRRLLMGDAAGAPEAPGLARGPCLSPAAAGYVPAGLPSFQCGMGSRGKALVVGIGYRGDRTVSPLPACVNDVRVMFRVLVERFGFHRNNVTVLCDETPGVGETTLYAPTRENILGGMRWLLDGAVPGESYFFFFAGHGDMVVDISGDAVETGYDQLLLPWDHMVEGVEPILDDTIFELLVRSVPLGARLTAVVDACRSGTICDLPVWYYEDGSPGSTIGNDNELLKCHSNPPRQRRQPHESAGEVVLFSGSADHQLSANMMVDCGPSSGVQPFGIMTRSFVDAVQECAEGGCVWTFGQLLDRIKLLVSERARCSVAAGVEKQVPQLTSSHYFDIYKTKFTI